MVVDGDLLMAAMVGRWNSCDFCIGAHRAIAIPGVEPAFVDACLACGAAFEGSGKPLVIASGTPAVRGRSSTEEDPAPTDGPAGGRGRNALAVLDLAAKDVRSAVVRLPRSVHARGEG